MSLTPAQKDKLRETVADWLVDMEPLFDPRCKLTFVMRAPHLPDGDLVVTGDDVQAVIAALQRLATYEVIGGNANESDTSSPSGASPSSTPAEPRG